MTIAHRCLDKMHVEATGHRDRHQGIAVRERIATVLRTSLASMPSALASAIEV